MTHTLLDYWKTSFGPWTLLGASLTLCFVALTLPSSFSCSLLFFFHPTHPQPNPFRVASHFPLRLLFFIWLGVVCWGYYDKDHVPLVSLTNRVSGCLHLCFIWCRQREMEKTWREKKRKGPIKKLIWFRNLKFESKITIRKRVKRQESREMRILSFGLIDGKNCIRVSRIQRQSDWSNGCAGKLPGTWNLLEKGIRELWDQGKSVYKKVFRVSS